MVNAHVLCRIRALLLLSFVMQLCPQMSAQASGSPASGTIATQKNDAGAAARLREALPQGSRLLDMPVRHDEGPGGLARALAQAGAGDTLVLWLRPEDLGALPQPAPAPAAVYVSGLMGGLEKAPLAPAWREVAQVTYPYALPAERSLRLNYPLGWFHLRRIPVVNERVQVDTYIACSVLLETLERRYGIKLANGQGHLKGKIFRLGHMGYIDQWDVLAAIAALELALLEMGHSCEVGAGVAAFQQALAQDVRQPAGAM